MWRLPMFFILWGRQVVAFASSAEPRDGLKLRFSKRLLVGLTHSLLKPRVVFPLVLTAPITQCWRLLKIPSICYKQVCWPKTQVCCLWGEKASLVGQKTFGVLPLSLCSIFLALLGCKRSRSCPVPANPFRSAVIRRGFVREALKSCSSCSLPFEIKRGICAETSLKFLCNSLDFALN